MVRLVGTNDADLGRMAGPGPNGWDFEQPPAAPVTPLPGQYSLPLLPVELPEESAPFEGDKPLGMPMKVEVSYETAQPGAVIADTLDGISDVKVLSSRVRVARRHYHFALGELLYATDRLLTAIDEKDSPRPAEAKPSLDVDALKARPRAEITLKELGLQPGLVRMMASCNINTIHDVEAWMAHNGSLHKLPGVGAHKEKLILEAMGKVPA